MKKVLMFGIVKKVMRIDDLNDNVVVMEKMKTEEVHQILQLENADLNWRFCLSFVQVLRIAKIGQVQSYCNQNPSRVTATRSTNMDREKILRDNWDGLIQVL